MHTARTVDPRRSPRLLALLGAALLAGGLACIGGGEENNEPMENNATENNTSGDNNTTNPNNTDPNNTTPDPNNTDPNNTNPNNTTPDPNNTNPNNTTPDPNNTDPNNTNPNNTTDPNNTNPNNTSAGTGWQIFGGTLPCADKAAIWFDDDDNGFWGCGKSGTGGLWTTTDGGLTWTKQARVNEKINDFFRDSTGRMVLAGQFGGPVAELDESNPAILKAEPLYQRGNNGFTSVEQGESVAVTSDGQILVDSLTGTTAAYFPGDNAAGKAWFEQTCTGDDASNFNPDSTNTWCELHGVDEGKLADPEATVSQISSIILHEDRFYAAGRWIADAGKVQLPSKLEGATYHMQQLDVQDGGNGEMMEITSTGNGSLVAVGTDQSENFPLLFTCPAGSDCYAAEGWTRAELDFFFIDEYWTLPASGSRDGRAVASAGDIVVAVGNFVPNGKGGWALISYDNGTTWEDLTPALNELDLEKERVPMLYDVHIFESGKILLVGDTSYIYTPE